MLKLAFRNIFRNRMRSSLTLAAIMAGVAAIIVSGGFVEDVFIQLREATIHSRLGHLQVYRQGYLEFGKREPSKYQIAQPKPILDAVRADPRVRAVMMRVNFTGLASNGRADLPVVGEGMEPGKEARLASAMTFVSGRQLRDADTTGVVIGEGVAAALKLHPGSFLNLTVNTPEGALNSLEFTVVGVFRTFSKEYDDRAVRIPLPAAQDLLYTQAIDAVAILLDDTGATDGVAAALRSRLGAGEYEVKPWYELADFYEKTVALYRRQFGALQFIILVMLLLSVTGTVNMAVYERTGEFGTLMAIGLRRRQIFRLVLIENSLLGVIGGALGVALGIMLALMVSGIGITMPPPPGSNTGYTAVVRLVPWVLAVAPFIGVVATLLAAVLPARRAARLPVVDALRQNI